MREKCDIRIDDRIHTDILLSYINNWLTQRPHHGIVATEITDCIYPRNKTYNNFLFYFNYINRPEYENCSGNLNFVIGLDEYKRLVRNKLTDELLK